MQFVLVHTFETPHVTQSIYKYLRSTENHHIYNTKYTVTIIIPLKHTTWL